MKVFALTLAFAGLAAAAPMNAQILSRSRLPGSGNTNGTYNDGQWYSVGSDNGGTIYERRTYDRNGNLVIQRARRNSNGTFSIISSRTVNNGNNGNNGNGDCTYNRTTNTVGDIVFGRTGTSASNCNDRGDRNNGGWYPVGDNNGNGSIYERRTRDRNGNIVIQRARRNSNGTFTILNSRTVSNNGNGTWNNDGRRDRDDDDRWDDRRGNNGNDKEWQKEQKRREKESRKGNKRNGRD
jgi:hypothetical protein